MALTAHYIIFVGLILLQWFTSNWKVYLEQLSFVLSVLSIFPCPQSTVHDSSLCQWGDWPALQAAFKNFVHYMSVPRCHIIFFQALFFLYCCWYFVCLSLLLIFELVFSGNYEKNLSVFLGCQLLILYASQDFYSLGPFFAIYFACIDTEHLRNSFKCIYGQLLSGVTIWEHWCLMFIKQHSSL